MEVGEGINEWTPNVSMLIRNHIDKVNRDDTRCEAPLFNVKIRKIEAHDDERWRLMLLDGSKKVIPAILSAEYCQNNRIDKLRKGDLIRITHYVTTYVGQNKTDSEIQCGIMIGQLEILEHRDVDEDDRFEPLALIACENAKSSFKLYQGYVLDVKLDDKHYSFNITDGTATIKCSLTDGPNDYLRQHLKDYIIQPQTILQFRNPHTLPVKENSGKNNVNELEIQLNKKSSFKLIEPKSKTIICSYLANSEFISTKQRKKSQPAIVDSDWIGGEVIFVKSHPEFLYFQIEDTCQAECIACDTANVKLRNIMKIGHLLLLKKSDLKRVNTGFNMEYPNVKIVVDDTVGYQLVDKKNGTAICKVLVKDEPMTEEITQPQDDDESITQLQDDESNSLDTKIEYTSISSVTATENHKWIKGYVMIIKSWEVSLCIKISDDTRMINCIASGRAMRNLRDTIEEGHVLHLKNYQVKFIDSEDNGLSKEDFELIINKSSSFKLENVNDGSMFCQYSPVTVALSTFIDNGVPYLDISTLTETSQHDWLQGIVVGVTKYPTVLHLILSDNNDGMITCKADDVISTELSKVVQIGGILQMKNSHITPVDSKDEDIDDKYEIELNSSTSLKVIDAKDGSVISEYAPQSTVSESTETLAFPESQIDTGVPFMNISTFAETYRHDWSQGIISQLKVYEKVICITLTDINRCTVLCKAFDATIQILKNLIQIGDILQIKNSHITQIASENEVNNRFEIKINKYTSWKLINSTNGAVLWDFSPGNEVSKAVKTLITPLLQIDAGIPFIDISTLSVTCRHGWFQGIVIMTKEYSAVVHITLSDNNEGTVICKAFDIAYTKLKDVVNVGNILHIKNSQITPVTSKFAKSSSDFEIKLTKFTNWKLIDAGNGSVICQYSPESVTSKSIEPTSTSKSQIDTGVPFMNISTLTTTYKHDWFQGIVTNTKGYGTVLHLTLSDNNGRTIICKAFDIANTKLKDVAEMGNILQMKDSHITPVDSRILMYANGFEIKLTKFTIWKLVDATNGSVTCQYSPEPDISKSIEPLTTSKSQIDTGVPFINISTLTATYKHDWFQGIVTMTKGYSAVCHLILSDNNGGTVTCKAFDIANTKLKDIVEVGNILQMKNSHITPATRKFAKNNELEIKLNKYTNWKLINASTGAIICQYLLESDTPKSIEPSTSQPQINSQIPYINISTLIATDKHEWFRGIIVNATDYNAVSHITLTDVNGNRIICKSFKVSAFKNIVKVGDILQLKNSLITPTNPKYAIGNKKFEIHITRSTNWKLINASTGTVIKEYSPEDRSIKSKSVKVTAQPQPKNDTEISYLKIATLTVTQNHDWILAKVTKIRISLNSILFYITDESGSILCTIIGSMINTLQQYITIGILISVKNTKIEKFTDKSGRNPFKMTIDQNASVKVIDPDTKRVLFEVLKSTEASNNISTNSLTQDCKEINCSQPENNSNSRTITGPFTRISQLVDSQKNVDWLRAKVTQVNCSPRRLRFIIKDSSGSLLCTVSASLVESLQSHIKLDNRVMLKNSFSYDIEPECQTEMQINLEMKLNNCSAIKIFDPNWRLLYETADNDVTQNNSLQESTISQSSSKTNEFLSSLSALSSVNSGEIIDVIAVILNVDVVKIKRTLDEKIPYRMVSIGDDTIIVQLVMQNISDNDSFNYQCGDIVMIKNVRINGFSHKKELVFQSQSKISLAPNCAIKKRLENWYQTVYNQELM